MRVRMQRHAWRACARTHTCTIRRHTRTHSRTRQRRGAQTERKNYTTCSCYGAPCCALRRAWVCSGACSASMLLLLGSATVPAWSLLYMCTPVCVCVCVWYVYVCVCVCICLQTVTIAS